jgi:hypothetical protein
VRGRSLLILGLALAAGRPASAQSITRESVEIAGFYGYRTGGAFADGGGLIVDVEGSGSFGGTLTVNLKKEGNFKLEFLFSRQDTNLGLLPLTVDHYQGGIVQEKGRPERRFFGSFLLGASRFAAPGFSGQTKFSLSLGLGMKFFLGKNVGLRFDTRALMVAVNSEGGALCAGSCVFYYSGNSFWQFEATGGLLLAF